ncbi:MAG: GTPase HflX [Firmicutes bacterium]|nr:GTPase HflX [Bacillota bacterium]
MITFNDNNEITDGRQKGAVLVCVNFGTDISDSERELEGLAAAAGLEVLGILEQTRERPDTATYIGKGKVEELKDAVEKLGADTVLFNDELSGVQLRNLEEALGVSVIDRTILILDIFADRAVSSIGKLEVELAQLKYRLPRLTGFGRSLSRTGGGIGTRGPGEKKLETDRRHIRARMDDIRREIRDAEKSRDLNRKQREKSEIPVAALVGYTNAGKSAVMNRFLAMNGTEERAVLEKDMLFATLDVSHRNIRMEDNREFILIDTVGFVSRLPHTLVEAFKGTLEEALYADVLIEVVDVSSGDYEFKMDVTDRLLADIGAGDIPKIIAYNKIDLLEEDRIRISSADDYVKISAREGTGMETLLEKTAAALFPDRQETEVLIPYDKGSIISYLCEKCSVLEMDYRDNGTYLRVMLDGPDRRRLESYILQQKGRQTWQNT